MIGRAVARNVLTEDLFEPMEGLSNDITSQEQQGFPFSQLQPFCATKTIERELQYFLSLELLREDLDIEKLPFKIIKQSFFAPELYPIISIFLLELSGRESLPLDFRVTQIRVRHVIAAGEDQFFIEMKGRAPIYEEFERLELSVMITAALYQDLFKLCKAGTIEKKRYATRGYLYHAKTIIPIEAEIDILERIGKADKSQDLPVLGFAIAELELKERQHVDLLRSGKHTLSFLSQAIDLYSIDRSIRKSLSSRRLAKRGIDQRAQQALAHLFSLVKD